jgi:hypothetical protein
MLIHVNFKQIRILIFIPIQILKRMNTDPNLYPQQLRIRISGIFIKYFEFKKTFNAVKPQVCVVPSVGNPGLRPYPEPDLEGS